LDRHFSLAGLCRKVRIKCGQIISTLSSLICPHYQPPSTAANAYIFADTLSATEGSKGKGIGATSYLGREFTKDEGLAVAVAVLLVWGLLNLLRVDHLGYVQNLGAVWQVLTTLAIVATLLAYPAIDERASDKVLWRHVENESGFLSIPYVCLLGLLPSLYGFTGKWFTPSPFNLDPSTHLSTHHLTQHGKRRRT
jgi:hypothetical protein